MLVKGTLGIVDHPGPGALQWPVSGAEGDRQMEAGDRSLGPPPLHDACSLQDRDGGFRPRKWT